MDKNLKKKFSSPAYLAAAAAATTVNTTAPLHSPRPRRSVPCDRSSSPYLLLGIIRFSSLGAARGWGGAVQGRDRARVRGLSVGGPARQRRRLGARPAEEEASHARREACEGGAEPCEGRLADSAGPRRSRSRYCPSRRGARTAPRRLSRVSSMMKKKQDAWGDIEMLSSMMPCDAPTCN